MSRLVAAVLGLSLVASTAVLAYAATTPVDAGVLQTQTQPVDIDLPPPPSNTYTITVIVRRFNGGNTDQVGKDADPVVVQVPAGGAFTIAWNGGTTVDCDTVNNAVHTGEQKTYTGEHHATGDATLILCVQTGNGTLSVTVGSTASAPASSSFTTSTEAEPLWLPSLEDLAADACRDGGWAEMRDADLVPYDSEAACIEAEVAAYRERVASSGGTP